MILHPYEEEHIKRLREGAPGCAVLLKSSGDFPLDGPCDLALYGSGARNTVRGGTGSGEVNTRYFVTIEEGLKKAGFNITTNSWLDAYDSEREKAKKRFVEEIKERAKRLHINPSHLALSVIMPEPEYAIPISVECQVAVYVLSRLSGEGSDREVVGGDVLMTGAEIRDIINLSKRYEKLLLVINSGGPVDISPVVDRVDNILLFSQLGSVSGEVFADLLLGESYPSGKLTTTWADYYDYQTIGEFGERDDTHYREGIYVGYRYFDSMDIKPLFPFGYGLSYTSFKLSAAEISHRGETITISVDVKNTGKRPGREVVQVYVSKPDKHMDTPYQELCAFKKTGELLPGESETVTCEFNMSDITVYDTASATYILDEGDYLIRVGTSSDDTSLSGVVRLSRTYKVKQVKNCAGIADPEYSDWQPAVKRSKHRGKLPAKAKVLELTDEDIKETAVDYDRDYAVDERIKACSDEELSYMLVGAFDLNGGLVDEPPYTVAGAVGQTAEVFGKLDIKRLVMADGPAGLRLARDYFVDASGVHAMGATMADSASELLPAPARSVMKLMEKRPKEKRDIRHQYCTAIPIATAIAQSFDTDFAADCGDIVAAEMELFGVDLWLAPGMNIHRNIRCGRNFEYFSEDPYLTGMMAKAITNSVQSHPGCGVTVKHFVCNNQETNRSNNNSVVSERALREIYLRGFELCMKYSSPAALMTSYNLLNKEHSASKEELISCILRCELGYDGVVMTDWWVDFLGNEDKASVYSRMLPHEVIMAGGDLFMPGSRKDHRELLDSLRDGRLDRSKMEIGASRIVALAKRLAAD